MASSTRRYPADIDCTGRTEWARSLTAPHPSKNRTCQFPGITAQAFQRAPLWGSPSCSSSRSLGAVLTSRQIRHHPSLLLMSPLPEQPGILRLVRIGVLRDLDIATRRQVAQPYDCVPPRPFRGLTPDREDMPSVRVPLRVRYSRPFSTYPASSHLRKHLLIRHDVLPHTLLPERRRLRTARPGLTTR